MTLLRRLLFQECQRFYLPDWILLKRICIYVSNNFIYYFNVNIFWYFFAFYIALIPMFFLSFLDHIQFFLYLWSRMIDDYLYFVTLVNLVFLPVQLQIEDITRRLRSGDLGIPPNPEDRL